MDLRYLRRELMFAFYVIVSDSDVPSRENEVVRSGRLPLGTRQLEHSEIVRQVQELELRRGMS